MAALELSALSVSLHGVLGPGEWNHPSVEIKKYCILNGDGSMEVGHTWASWHNSQCVSLAHYLFSLLVTVPSLPLEDHLLPFSVSMLQVEMREKVVETCEASEIPQVQEES